MKSGAVSDESHKSPPRLPANALPWTEEEGAYTSACLTSIMPPFRKRSLSATSSVNGPPPVFEYIKQKFTAFHPRTKNKRTLAASSNTIAPHRVASASVSPSRDPTDIAANQPGSSKESGWSAAYGAARMAVKIANASTDMFLPLKAVVGALSVLLKNFDVSTHWQGSCSIRRLPLPAANHCQ